jgi:RNA polymerase sigma factor (TIGR02999 family)
MNHALKQRHDDGVSDQDVDALAGELALQEDIPFKDLFAAAYGRLLAIAHSQRRRWRGEETLSTTALLHEAYLKLACGHEPRWRDRGHFLRVAARTMRHILINYAERSRTQKRGGVPMTAGGPQVEASREASLASAQAAEIDGDRLDELLTLDEALQRLEKQNPRQAQVVEALFFGGLKVEEVAEALDVAPITVMREWRRGKAWLYLQLK